MSLNFIINAGFLIVPLAIQLGTLSKLPAENSCSVQIQVGKRIDGNAVENAGGSVPHLALWDGDGNRIGQYKGDANGHIRDGDTASYTIYNTQNGDKPAQPDYLSLSMQETDAICITMIFVQGTKLKGLFNSEGHSEKLRLTSCREQCTVELDRRHGIFVSIFNPPEAWRSTH